MFLGTLEAWPSVMFSLSSRELSRTRQRTPAPGHGATPSLVGSLKSPLDEEIRFVE